MRETRPLHWLLLSATATLLILIAMLITLFLGNVLTLSTPATPARTTDEGTWAGKGEGLALDVAASQAAARAHLWAQDAFLVRAEATWRPGSARKVEHLPPLVWSFYYYSPSESSLASVAVTNTRSFWVPPMEIPTPPPRLTTFPPPTSADIAWLSFRAAGGDTFLRDHPDALVYLRLRQWEGRTTWEIAAVHHGQRHAALVDAQSGRVIEP